MHFRYGGKVFVESVFDDRGMSLMTEDGRNALYVYGCIQCHEVYTGTLEDAQGGPGTRGWIDKHDHGIAN